MRNVGDRIAAHVLEIVQTGDLQILNELKARQDLSTIKLFTQIHGVGPTTAQSLYAQGFRTIDDLKTKARLNNQQKTGLKYYSDLQVRIPRDEVAGIEIKVCFCELVNSYEPDLSLSFAWQVKEAALRINPGLIVEACGSFRRKKPTCGDVDVLITHPDGHSHKGVFNKLIDALHQESESFVVDCWTANLLSSFSRKDFLIDDLVSNEDAANQKKYMGICRLPGPNMLVSACSAGRNQRRLRIVFLFSSIDASTS